jgi:hypothetical protein
VERILARRHRSLPDRDHLGCLSRFGLIAGTP